MRPMGGRNKIEAHRHTSESFYSGPKRNATLLKNFRGPLFRLVLRYVSKLSQGPD
jgi:hypothetical protein